MKRTVRAFAVAAIAILSAALLSTPASAQGGSLLVLGPGGNTGCWLHAHAFNYPLDMPCRSTPEQSWVLINGQRWTSIRNGIVRVAELQLVGTPWCVNWVNRGNYPAGLFYLDSCVHGDANELFWVQPKDNEGDSWYINAAASDTHRAYIYMDPAAAPAPEPVVGEGAGLAVVWFSPFN